MRDFCLFFIISLFSLFMAIGQEDTICRPNLQFDKQAGMIPVSFDTSHLDQYRESNDFDYSQKITEKNWWDRFKAWISERWNAFWEWLFGDIKPGSWAAILTETLTYLVIIGIIIFAGWLFIRLNPGKNYLLSPKNGRVFLSEDEKIIQEENIPSLIEQALNQQNYRLAIRYHYLLILKGLKTQGIIGYEFQKTNHDYLNEMKSGMLKTQFEKITRLYDFIWYGGFSITAQDFQAIEKTFLSIQNELKNPTT